MLMNVNKNSQVSNAFYSRYHIMILTDILEVMTDGFHKSGLDVQTKIFYILIHITTQNIVNIPLYRSTIRFPPTNPQTNRTRSISMDSWWTNCLIRFQTWAERWLQRRWPTGSRKQMRKRSSCKWLTIWCWSTATALDRKGRTDHL